MFRRLLDTRAPAAVILIRLMVAIVFISEGIQKFLYPDRLGAGRFTSIGIPMPEIAGPLVASVETIGGVCILVGFLTRIAAIPLLVDISVAIVSTKLPILLGRGFWGFQRPALNQYGLWSMLHEARTDLSMWLALVFLLLVGAGAWSFDRHGRP
jgi:uncharacterized membrane protein YphA (DoxX/SURF4 family)